MQFAVPTRNHRSSPFLSASTSSTPSPSYMLLSLRRRRPLVILVGFVVFLLVVVNLKRRSSSETGGYSLGGETGTKAVTVGAKPGSGPKTVLVTVIDREHYEEAYLQRILENRREYAEAHGYGMFVANHTDYQIGPVPVGWARIPAVRHAMAVYGHSDNFWYLDQNALIMNPTLSLEKHITSYSRLGSLMIKDVPIVPPDSVIRSYRHTPPERIQFILTQDHDGLNPGSFIIKRGMWARYFLDVWYDPLFRMYNFQKAEQHALEHIVQWHPTILTKLALIPQRIINSYPTPPGGEGSYEDGDFVVHFQGCEAKGRSCEREVERLWESRGRAGKK